MTQSLILIYFTYFPSHYSALVVQWRQDDLSVHTHIIIGEWLDLDRSRSLEVGRVASADGKAQVSPAPRWQSPVSDRLLPWHHLRLPGGREGRPALQPACSAEVRERAQAHNQGPAEGSSELLEGTNWHLGK